MLLGFIMVLMFLGFMMLLMLLVLLVLLMLLLLQVSGSIKRISDFLNSFDTSCRGRLSGLDEQLTRLERKVGERGRASFTRLLSLIKVTFLEARTQGGGRQD